MEGFEFICNLLRILRQGVAPERVTASGYTPPGQDHVSSRRVYHQARSVVFAFFTRVQSLHLFNLIIVCLSNSLEIWERIFIPGTGLDQLLYYPSQ